MEVDKPRGYKFSFVETLRNFNITKLSISELESSSVLIMFVRFTADTVTETQYGKSKNVKIQYIVAFYLHESMPKMFRYIIHSLWYVSYSSKTKNTQNYHMLTLHVEFHMAQFWGACCFYRILTICQLCCKTHYCSLNQTKKS